MDQPTYTHGHHDSVLRSHRWRTAENSAGYFLSELTPGTSLLDVGCGPGTITADLAARVAPGRVIGIDPSTSVIDEARTLNHGDAVEFAVANVYDLPFDDSTFDVVHAHQVLQHLDEPVRALEQMARVARPGGLIAARDADYESFAWYPELPGLDAWREMYGAVARAHGGEPNGGRHLKRWARQAGLEDLSATVTSWCFSTTDERQWWGELWADRTTHSRLAERALALDVCSAADLDEMSAAWRRWAADPDGWFSAPSAEIVCRVTKELDRTGA